MSKSRNCEHNWRRVDIDDSRRERHCSKCGLIEDWMPDQYGNWHCDTVTCPHIWTHIYDSRECDWCGEKQMFVPDTGLGYPYGEWKKVSLKTSTDSCKCEQSTAPKCLCPHGWVHIGCDEGHRMTCSRCGEVFELVTEGTVERKLVWKALRAEKCCVEAEEGTMGVRRDVGIRLFEAESTVLKLQEELEKAKEENKVAWKQIDFMDTKNKELRESLILEQEANGRLVVMRKELIDDRTRLRAKLAEVRDENRRLLAGDLLGKTQNYWLGVEGLKENYRHQLKEAKEKLNSISSGLCLDPDFMLMGETSRFWLGLKWDHGVQKAQLEKGRKEYKELEAKFESVCRLHMHELNERIKAQDNNGAKVELMSHLRQHIKELECALATAKKQNQRRWCNRKTPR